MEIKDKINKYLNEAKDVAKKIGSIIEEMDLSVSDKDRKKFDTIIEIYLKVVDPRNKLTIQDAVIRLGEEKAKELYDQLKELNYDSDVNFERGFK